jgi:cytochrome P450
VHEPATRSSCRSRQPTAILKLFDRPRRSAAWTAQPNRHLAFGVGIHRCLGSHLARLEVTVAVERFLAGVERFEVADEGAVRWSTGQVRGPRELPLALVR